MDWINYDEGLNNFNSDGGSDEKGYWREMRWSIDWF